VVALQLTMQLQLMQQQLQHMQQQLQLMHQQLQIMQRQVKPPLSTLDSCKCDSESHFCPRISATCFNLV